jgi:hypothetical protein
MLASLRKARFLDLNLLSKPSHTYLPFDFFFSLLSSHKLCDTQTTTTSTTTTSNIIIVIQSQNIKEKRRAVRRSKRAEFGTECWVLDLLPSKYLWDNNIHIVHIEYCLQYLLVQVIQGAVQ